MGISIRNDNGQSSDKIFVYDHLKHKGRENHSLLSAGCTLVGRASIKKFQMYEILNSYPIIMPVSSPKIEVIGEIWNIGHAKLLETLDGFKSPMHRNIFEIEFKKKKYFVWTYFMPEFNFNQDAPGVRPSKTGKWII